MLASCSTKTLIKKVPVEIPDHVYNWDNCYIPAMLETESLLEYSFKLQERIEKCQNDKQAIYDYAQSLK